MATAESVKNKIQGLIDSANAVTGNSDADMTTAVAALIAGFGAGGESGGVIYSGTYMTAERVVDNLVFSTPGGVSNFAMFLSEAPALNTGVAFFTALVGSKDGRVICCGSGNTGTNTSVASIYNPGNYYSYYYGLNFEAESVTLIASKSNLSYSKAPQAGKTYIWAAW